MRGKKIWQRTGAVLLVLSVSIGLLSGCGSS